MYMQYCSLAPMNVVTVVIFSYTTGSKNMTTKLFTTALLVQGSHFLSRENPWFEKVFKVFPDRWESYCRKQKMWKVKKLKRLSSNGSSLGRGSGKSYSLTKCCHCKLASYVQSEHIYKMGVHGPWAGPGSSGFFDAQISILNESVRGRVSHSR